MNKKALMAVFVASMCSVSSAGTIIGATDALILNGGPGIGDIRNTFNQAGLLMGYTSGVTNFSTYIGSNPLHDQGYPGNEWFSEYRANLASVIYDLGTVRTIQSVAFWNEDASGGDRLDLFHSADGLVYSLLAASLRPTNNVQGQHYGADVFSFDATNTRYVRFDLSACPQPGSAYQACSLGEVAFEAVPEPATLALFGLGLAGIAGLRRRSEAA